MPQASVPPHPWSAWPVALRRGTTLGIVAACHLALLALLLRPAPYREASPGISRGADDAMQLLFIPPAKPLPVAMAASPSRARLLPSPAPRPQSTAAASSTPGTAVSTIVTSLPPQATFNSTVPEYQAGDFRTRLQDAQRVRAVPLPGSATPRVGGFRMRVAPSAQDLMRRLAVATRCTAAYFDMQNSKTRFVTAQQMDRLLEADGCGPHAERTRASEAVDALTRQLMDER
jgi:hypothetical protein